MMWMVSFVRMLVSYDLGADELMLTIQIDPLLGGSTVIRSPYISETFMLQVPPGAITDPVTMTLAPFSGNSMLGCSGVVNSLIGGIGSSIGGIGGLAGPDSPI